MNDMVSTQSDSSSSLAAAPRRDSALAAGLSAAAMTIPHAIALGLIAFAPLGGSLPLVALALWSAALPGAILAVLARRPGIVYAPPTVAVLVYPAVAALVLTAGHSLQLATLQTFAVCAVTLAMAFGFQWLFGAFRLASLARFLPVPVIQGFAAGVGLSMVMGQLRTGFGSGAFTLDTRMFAHAAAAGAVYLIARGVQMRWRGVPGLLPAILAVSVFVAASGLDSVLQAPAGAAVWGWPVLPDWVGVPWAAVARTMGLQLVSLALLTAIVNSLDIVVFNQELELDHGLRSEPNAALRRESLAGMLCAFCGFIPASTSASRSRIALAKAGPEAPVGTMHAALLLGVAATGPLWMPWIPIACLSGALLVAGVGQVPKPLWSANYLRTARTTFAQGWFVAVMFVVAGGTAALFAGLVVATFVLLHASTSNVVRRALLDGEIRSRRLRRATSEAWIAPRMNQVAVIDLHGVMSFGIAAHMAEQVRGMAGPRHRWVILDAHRVAAWDGSALARLRSLAGDFQRRGTQLVVCALDAGSRAALGDTPPHFADLDRALEWAEDEILDERYDEQLTTQVEADPLGELTQGLETAARETLESVMDSEKSAADSLLFEAGDMRRDLFVLRFGRVTLATAWPQADGMRVSTIGAGMAFGEMAFLNGQPRTAYAGAETDVQFMRLSRDAFDWWAKDHPHDALMFMANLAQIGTRRLAATTRQLRAVLE